MCRSEASSSATRSRSVSMETGCGVMRASYRRAVSLALGRPPVITQLREKRRVARATIPRGVESQGGDFLSWAYSALPPEAPGNFSATGAMKYCTPGTWTAPTPRTFLLAVVGQLSHHLVAS